jgi:hypothetical protein
LCGAKSIGPASSLFSWQDFDHSADGRQGSRGVGPSRHQTVDRDLHLPLRANVSFLRSRQAKRSQTYPSQGLESVRPLFQAQKANVLRSKLKTGKLRLGRHELLDLLDDVGRGDGAEDSRCGIGWQRCAHGARDQGRDLCGWGRWRDRDWFPEEAERLGDPCCQQVAEHLGLLL